MQKEVYEFISKKTSDPIIEWRTCRVSGEEFPIFQSDKEFYEKISPSVGGQKYQIPFPTLCPEERERRRMMFKNERHLYSVTCDVSQEKTVSRFTNKIIRTNRDWHADDREQIQVEYDPNKTIQEHIRYLVEHTVYQDLIGSPKNVLYNAKYTNHTSKQSHTYLLFNSRDDEYGAYGDFVLHSKYVFDVMNVSHAEHCYECVSCREIFQCFFCNDCSASTDLRFCSSMKGCQHCLFSYGLHNQSYCIRNQQVSKKEYQQFLAKIKQSSYQQWQGYIEEYVKNYATYTRVAMLNIGSEEVFGNECFDSAYAQFCYELQGCEDVKYATTCFESQDLMDITAYGESSYNMYEGCAVGKNSHNLLVCSLIGESQHMLYCMETKHSHHCFGCVNLYKKSYCIFNKQYSKEEYNRLLPQLIEKLQGEEIWGSFFDYSLAPVPYNDSLAGDFYPPHTIVDVYGKQHIFDEEGEGIVHLMDDHEIAQGVLDIGGLKKIPISWRTKEKEINITPGAETISASDLPDHINKVNEKIIEKVIVCETSGRPFRILPMELAFYQKHTLPLPRIHPELRYKRRFKSRPARTLYLRKCDKTGEEILSVYPSDSPCKVYSEEAYQQEVYG